MGHCRREEEESKVIKETDSTSFLCEDQEEGNNVDTNKTILSPLNDGTSSFSATGEDLCQIQVVAAEDFVVATDKDDKEEDEENHKQLPFPGFVPVVFRCLSQNSQPRSLFLRIITNPYPFYNLFYFFKSISK